jgi:hypothetical protein
MSTVASVPRFGHRLLLHPRDYLAEPYAFGRDPDPVTVVPEGGDERSRQVAFVQHHLALRLRVHARPGTGPGARAAARFGFSRQHWADCLAGVYWMSPVLFAAAAAVLLGVPDPHARAS